MKMPIIDEVDSEEEEIKLGALSSKRRPTLKEVKLMEKFVDYGIQDCWFTEFSYGDTLTYRK